MPHDEGSQKEYAQKSLRELYQTRRNDDYKAGYPLAFTNWLVDNSSHH
jgi:hypothetical protein